LSFPRLLRLMFLLLGLSLTGCSQQEEIVEPEDVALQFFNAVYNTKDAETARALVGDKIGELIDHYRSISNIQRHVIGMQMPGRPSIDVEVKNTSADFFRRLDKKHVQVEVRFSSEVDGRKYYDSRTVILTKVGNNYWLITEILDDPFAVNG